MPGLQVRQTSRRHGAGAIIPVMFIPVMHRLLPPLLVLLLLSGCATGRNYPSEASPRFSGTPDEIRGRSASGAEITVVSFNVEEGRHLDRALESLAEIPAADVLLLQEMDAEGTRYIAEALEMAWVYYPASKRDGSGFGNAVLSRFPIVEDEKVVLPHDAWVAGTQRTSTAATIDFGEARVRFHSVHLATPIAQSPGNRREQLRAVIERADRYPHAVVGGDLNSSRIAEMATATGWNWPTERGPRTTWLARVDHILLRGISLADSAATGTGTDPADASDHRPVWVRITLPAPRRSQASPSRPAR